MYLNNFSECHKCHEYHECPGFTSDAVPEPLYVGSAGGAAWVGALARALARAGWCPAGDYLLPGVNLRSGGGN